MPRVLIAPNAFKGSLSAGAAARLIARGLRRVLPGVRLDLMPVSDGGDGLMEVLLARVGGLRVFRPALDALGRPGRVPFALLDDGSAVVEMARASGIARLGGAKLDPLGATSFGTGQLIGAALRRLGGRRGSLLVVGMGGSASSDGGAGMAQALGARLLDPGGRDLPRGAEALLRLERIDASPLRGLLGGARVLGVSDVINPLLGPKGSARVYGPQKGAGPAQVRLLEKALLRYARILRRDLGVEAGSLPGGGAAGGLGAGLGAFLGARLQPGAAWVLERLDARRRIREADLVVTGEGRLDAQSFYGKAPLELAAMAAREGKPVVLVCGSADPAVIPRLRRLGAKVETLLGPGESVKACMARTPRRLERLGGALARGLQ